MYQSTYTHTYLCRFQPLPPPNKLECVKYYWVPTIREIKIFIFSHNLNSYSSRWPIYLTDMGKLHWYLWCHWYARNSVVICQPCNKHNCHGQALQLIRTFFFQFLHLICRLQISQVKMSLVFKGTVSQGRIHWILSDRSEEYRVTGAYF